jgi:hypothetical protein
VSKIDSKKRQAVIEITLDTNSMKLIAKNVSKSHTSNRSFHVQKLALEALQEIRIKHRWEAMDIRINPYYKLNQKTKTILPTLKAMAIL